MSLQSLPNELTDQIFSNVDWDRQKDIYPVKQDIINASVTCKRLREVLTPRVFRDVVLRLGWVDDNLVEPRLFKLRKQLPELAKHIRCVFIRVEFAGSPHSADQDKSFSFVVPDDVQDWTNPSGLSQDSPTETDAAFRARVDEHAQQIINPLAAHSSSSPDTVESAENAILSFKRRNGRNAELDALAIVMLCIPATTNTIVFKSLTTSYTHETKANFATQLLATALDIHRDNVRNLVVSTNTSAKHLKISRQALARLGTGGPEVNVLSTPVLNSLSTSRLTIATSDKNWHTNTRRMMFDHDYERWHLMTSVRHLDLRYIRADVTDLLPIIQGFQNLETLSIQDCELAMIRGQPNPRPSPNPSIWLELAIQLRRSHPEVLIALSNIYLVTSPSIGPPLPECQVRWILEEAVPQGAVIDLDRETRLLEDFTSFASLWMAENSERGAQAMAAWATQRATLSDEAMSRRWR